MTKEEKQEIIAVINDTIKSVLYAQIEFNELKETLTRYIRQTEAQKPFLCSEVKCKNRKLCKGNV